LVQEFHLGKAQLFKMVELPIGAIRQNINTFTRGNSHFHKLGQLLNWMRGAPVRQSRGEKAEQSRTFMPFKPIRNTRLYYQNSFSYLSIDPRIADEKLAGVRREQEGLAHALAI
jgi:hypothetical protein